MATFAHIIAARFRDVKRTVEIAIERAVRDELRSQPPPVPGKPDHEGMSPTLQLHHLRTRTDPQSRKVHFDEENVRKLLVEVGEERQGLDERIKQALLRTGRAPLSKSFKTTSEKYLASYVDLLATWVYLDEWKRKQSNISFKEWVDDPLCRPGGSDWKPLPHQLRGLGEEDPTDDVDEPKPVRASKRKWRTRLGRNRDSRSAPRAGPTLPLSTSASVSQAVDTAKDTSTIVTPPAKGKGKRKADEIEDREEEADLLVNRRQALTSAAVAKEQAANASSAAIRAPGSSSGAVPRTKFTLSLKAAKRTNQASDSIDTSNTSTIDREKAKADMTPEDLTTRLASASEGADSAQVIARFPTMQSPHAPSYSPLTNHGDADNETPDYMAGEFVDYRKW